MHVLNRERNHEKAKGYGDPKGSDRHHRCDVQATANSISRYQEKIAQPNMQADLDAAREQIKHLNSCLKDTQDKVQSCQEKCDKLVRENSSLKGSAGETAIAVQWRAQILPKKVQFLDFKTLQPLIDLSFFHFFGPFIDADCDVRCNWRLEQGPPIDAPVAAWLAQIDFHDLVLKVMLGFLLFLRQSSSICAVGSALF